MRRQFEQAFYKSPLIIGGVGGSGTRLVTQILQEAGLHLGYYLNKALDNAHFSFVLNGQASSVMWPPERMKPSFDLFLALHFGHGWSIKTAAALLNVTARNSSMLYPPGGTLRDARHIYLRARRLRSIPQNGESWGWKEPRTQLYLPAINTYFPNCKYIHVIRHGLDMAFSENLNQLRLYGRYFNIDIPDNPAYFPATQLTYWIRSNTQTLRYCEEHLGNRHLLISYDDLCQTPETVIPGLLDFCNLRHDHRLLERLGNSIEPGTQGRYRSKDLTQFSPDQLKAVEDLGFPPG